MKRFLSIILVVLMAMPFALLASAADAPPAEPTLEASAKKLYIAHEGWQTYKDGDKTGNNATNPTATKGWAEGGNIYTLAQGGAMFIIEQKGYVGAVKAVIKSDKPIMFTGLDPADNKSNVAMDGDKYNTAATGEGQLGMFMKDTKSTNDADGNSLFIQSAVIFDNTVLLHRSNNVASIYHVEAGGAIVITKTTAILGQTYMDGETEKTRVAPALAVDEGGYAYLHNVGFSSYTGKGTIVLGDEIADDISLSLFESFNGTVCREDGSVLKFASIGFVAQYAGGIAGGSEYSTVANCYYLGSPSEETAQKTVYVSAADGADTNDGTSLSPVKTMAKAYEKLGVAGGIINIVGTYTQDANFFAPAHTGKITVKGADANAV